MKFSNAVVMDLKLPKATVMDNDNWALSNGQRQLGLNIETYYIKTAKSRCHGQRHLTIYEFQLPLFMTATLCTTFVFNSVSKLI